MKKRLLAMLLAAVMIVSALTACGAKPEEPAPEEKPQEETTEPKPEDPAPEEPAPEEPAPEESDAPKFDDVKLKYLLCWNFALPLSQDQYNNDVNTAIRDKIGVTVEVETIAMPETEKLNMMFASDDMPDILNAPYFGGQDPHTLIIKKAATEGRLLDISGEIDKYEHLKRAFDVGIVSRKFLENDLDDPAFNGARYVLPWQLPDGAENEANWLYGVFARADVLEELGVDPASIKTSDDLYDVMMQAKEHGFKDVNGNDAIPASLYGNGFYVEGFAKSFMEQKLTPFELDADGKVTSTMLGENFINQHMFIWKMVNSGLLDKECFRHSVDQANEKLGNGKALFCASQYAIPYNATKMTGLYDAHPEMRWVPVGPLNDVHGEPSVQVRSEGRTGSPGFMFPSSCANLDAALTWLDYINSPEGRTLTMYGFEGDTFEYNEEGQPRMNQTSIDAMQADANAWTAACVERGFGGSTIFGWSCVVDQSRSIFGEAAPFADIAPVDEFKAYEEMIPIKTIEGYPMDAVNNADFERYDEVTEVIDPEVMRDTIESAYFAETEEEARSILEGYQEMIRTANDGVFMDYLAFMNEMYQTRDDFVF